jgi:hypothetical protein
METNDDVLRLLVVAARAAALAPHLTPMAREEDIPPEPGDLVVETSSAQVRHPDPDAIGWLVGHGDAPYSEDGTGPKREVWDILPLSGRTQKDWGFQRWENADFRRVPKPLVERAGLQPPRVLAKT